MLVVSLLRLAAAVVAGFDVTMALQYNCLDTSGSKITCEYCGKYGGCKTEEYCKAHPDECCEEEDCSLACYNFDLTKNSLFISCPQGFGCSKSDKGGCGEDEGGDVDCKGARCNAKTCLTSSKVDKDTDIEFACPIKGTCEKMTAENAKSCWVKCKKTGFNQNVQYCRATDGRCISSTKCGFERRTILNELFPFTPKFECMSENHGLMAKCHEKYCQRHGGCGWRELCEGNDGQCCAKDKCNRAPCKKNSSCLAIPSDPGYTEDLPRAHKACDSNKFVCKLTCAVYRNPSQTFAYCNLAEGCSLGPNGGCGEGNEKDDCFDALCNWQACPLKIAEDNILNLQCFRGDPNAETNCEKVPMDSCFIRCTKWHGQRKHSRLCPASKGHCDPTSRDGCGDGTNPIRVPATRRPINPVDPNTRPAPKPFTNGPLPDESSEEKENTNPAAKTTPKTIGDKGAAGSLSAGSIVVLFTLCLHWLFK